MLYVTHDQMEAMSMGDRMMVLKRGVVQQIGTPIEVYNQPANNFVAGFIGSPAMNFLTGEIKTNDGGLLFDTGSLQIKVPELNDNLAGTRLTIGVRPEWIHLSDATNPAATFPAKVEVIERMGSDTFVTLSAGKHELTARLKPSIPVEMNETHEFAFDMAQARLFDEKTGLSIS